MEERPGATRSQETQVESTSMSGLLNEPLRAKVDALFGEHQRALEVAAREHDKDINSLRDALQTLIRSGDELCKVEIANLRELLLSKIDALEKLTAQYHEQQKYALEVATQEREKSASALREQSEKALSQASSEREKKAEALRTALSHDIETSHLNLRQHIDHQKESVEAAFGASKEAINKAEAATEKRFESVAEQMNQIQGSQGQFVLREVFEQDQADNRRRQDATLELLNGQSVRLTEIEARGGGEKDRTAELKSTLAIGIAFIVPIAIYLISLLGGSS